MKIQEIIFPLDLGVATDLEIQVLEFTDNGTSVNVHYDLRDLTKSTVLTSSYEFPYRNLHSNNLVLRDEDYTKYKENPNHITEVITTKLGVTLI